MHKSFASFLCSTDVLEHKNFLEFYIKYHTPIITISANITCPKITKHTKISTLIATSRQIFMTSKSETFEGLEKIKAHLISIKNNILCFRVYKSKCLHILDLLRFLPDEDFDPQVDPDTLIQATETFFVSAHDAVLHFLLEHKNYDVNLIDINGDNLLMKLLGYLFIENHIPLIVKVVNKTSNLNLLDHNDCNPLFLCLIFGHFEVFKLLLEKDTINANIIYDNSVSLPYFCIIMNKRTYFEELIKSGKLDLQLRTQNNENFLELCIFYNKYDFLPLFIDQIDINNEDIYGLTSVMLCILCNKMDFLEYILSKRNDANINYLHFIVDNSGLIQNPLSKIIFLLKNGADIDHIDEFGNTPVINSIIHNEIDITYALLQYNCDINIPNSDGLTPVAISCHQQNFYLVKLLILLGANINVKYHDTHLLNLMLKKRNLKLFELLINNNIHIETNDCIFCFYSSNIDPGQGFRQNYPQPFFDSWSSYAKKIISVNKIKRFWKKKRFEFRYKLLQFHANLPSCLVRECMTYLSISQYNNINFRLHNHKNFNTRSPTIK